MISRIMKIGQSDEGRMECWTSWEQYFPLKLWLQKVLRQTVFRLYLWTFAWFHTCTCIYFCSNGRQLPGHNNRQHSLVTLYKFLTPKDLDTNSIQRYMTVYFPHINMVYKGMQLTCLNLLCISIKHIKSFCNLSNSYSATLSLFNSWHFAFCHWCCWSPSLWSSLTLDHPHSNSFIHTHWLCFS